MYFCERGNWTRGMREEVLMPSVIDISAGSSYLSCIRFALFKVGGFC